MFAGDDALVVIDVLRKAIQQSGFAGPGAAGDQNVGPAAPDDLQDICALRRDGAEFDQLIQRQLVLFEFPNGERRAVDRQRRDDWVYARAVGDTLVVVWVGSAE